MLYDFKATITIDFETYFDTDYSLSKMTMQEYVSSDLFDTVCMSVAFDDGPVQCFWGDTRTLRPVIERIPWDKLLVVAHNAMFEGAILEWVFGVKAAAYYCTMQGARPHSVPYNKRMGLAKTAEFYELEAKGTATQWSRGMYEHQFNDWQKTEYMLYCDHDTELCRDIYHRQMENTPLSEQKLLHLNLIKFIRPQLRLDGSVLAAELNKVIHNKQTVLMKAADLLGLEPDDDLKKALMSNAKFATVLESLGVDPPLKISKTTGKETYAFAKTDEGMQELLEHDDDRIQALASARIGVKSTQMETRLQRFLDVYHCTDTNMFAVPLLYYGAHTGRYSGMDKLNLQNMPRGSALRYAIKALLPGRVILAVDLSQIEARITAVIAQQNDLVDAFSRGEDVYSLFATDLYGYKVTKKNVPQRFVGKQCILGLGYGLGPFNFAKNTNALAKVMGIDLELDEQQAKSVVYAYRKKYSKVMDLHVALDRALAAMREGWVYEIPGVPVIFMKGRCVLPNGMQIHYPDLQLNYLDSKDNVWEGCSFEGTKGRKKLYGGALLENIVQALARIVLARAELLLAERGAYAALSVHDELIYTVEEKKADILQEAVTLALTAEVPFLKSLPSECEGEYGESYGHCK